MLSGLSVEDLIALRIELVYAQQKVERATIALLTRTQHEKQSRNYTADQMKASKLEVEHAEFMLRGSAKKILPELELLAQEEPK